MIAIVDYGMGNLRSAQKGLERVGYSASITDRRADIDAADAVVLPGVGAFRDCYEGLRDSGLVDCVVEAARSGRPFLAVCVGMQLLFEESEEGGRSPGLGLFPGRVVRFPSTQATGLKVPHMGWNRLQPQAANGHPILQALPADAYAYFVHSYHAETPDTSLVAATAEYGVTFPAIVARDNVVATQFHPEKSQAAGLALLEAFGAMCPGVV